MYSLPFFFCCFFFFGVGGSDGDILATIMVMRTGDLSASVLMQLPRTAKRLYLEVVK